MIDAPKTEEEQEITASYVKKKLDDYPPNVASVYPGFVHIPGIKKPNEEKPEFSWKQLGEAVWDQSAWGLAQHITEDKLRPDYAQPDYDFLEHVDEEFLNENDIWYFVNDVNESQTRANNIKLRREKSAAEGISNYPFRYAAAYIAEGLVDPVNWMPTSRIAKAADTAYELAKAGKISLTAKTIAEIAAESTVLGAASATIHESLLQQTEITRDLIDSVYGVLATGMLSGVVGAAVPSVVSGVHYRKANAQVANILAGNDPTPTVSPKSKVFAMDATTEAVMKGDDVVASLPEITKKMLNISPAGRLRNSESVTANLAATDLSTSALIINKNVLKNQPTQIAVDDIIRQYRGKARKTSLDVNAIFMEQQGIKGNFLAGIKTRLYEAQGKGFDRVTFSNAVADVMESGNPSGFEHVNRAASRIQDYLTDIKQDLVKLGKMDETFLDPEFNNYFTHHWLEPVIARDHEKFKLIIYKWFSEVNEFYKANQDTLRPLVHGVERAQSELDKASRNIKRVVGSETYRAFQENKKNVLEELRGLRKGTAQKLKSVNKEIKTLQKDKSAANQTVLKEKLDLKKEIEEGLGLVRNQQKSTKSTRFERQVELEERIEKYKELIKKRKEALYHQIPNKYLTPGGWVPLGDKNPLELHAAAMQTFYRTTGSDVSEFINPLIGSPRTNPDPLQARLLSIPYDYEATNFSGETIRAKDFLSRDIWRMITNYAGATSSTIAFEKLARMRGFKEVSELKTWYLKGIEADYDEMLKGVSGKKAYKIHEKKKADYENVLNLFDQQMDIAGRSFDLFGKGFARFHRRLREYNSQRMLASASISSITDLAVAPFRQGIFAYQQEILMPFFRSIFSKTGAYKLNKADIKDLGFGIDTGMGMIAKRFYDNSDLLIEKKWWHNTAEFFVNQFHSITGMTQLNDAVQTIAGVASISRTLRAIDKRITKGKIKDKENIRLRHLTISEQSERHIYDMWKESGSIENGAYVSNMSKWKINSSERARAFEEFANSIGKDITHSTLKSSVGEQPAFYNSMIGKMLFHFKDYLIAANQKLLLSGIQKIGMREYEVLWAMLLLNAKGQFTYVLNAYFKDPTGKSVDLSAERLLREGLDRSALLALLMEPINIFQKQGWLPGQSVSRYQSRGILGNWVGPEIGTAQDLADALISPVVRKIKGEGVYSTKDALKILRLIPFQNLFYLRYLNEQIAKQTAESLGAVRKD